MLTLSFVQEAQQALLDELLLNDKKRLNKLEKSLVKSAKAAGMVGRGAAIKKGTCFQALLPLF